MSDERGMMNDEPDEHTGWLCVCGNFVDHDEHCENCGNEPPWGCDCSVCTEIEDDEEEPDYGKADYPDPWDYLDDLGEYDDDDD